MKRYYLRARYLFNNAEIVARVNDNGDWVRYEDVKQAVESYNDWVERGIWKEDSCNCAEMSENKRQTYCLDLAPDAWWICPAHGYKRL